MKKLVLSSLLAATLAFVLGFAAEAQQPKKLYRIGILFVGSSSFYATWIDVFRQGLKELGYIEGQNLVRINVLDGCASISAMATSRTSGRRATRLSCASMPTATEYFFTIVQY